MAQHVFLSYRGSDLAPYASALKIVLQQNLPDVSVFVDTESVTRRSAGQIDSPRPSTIPRRWWR
jgi:hypothetical protein